MTFTISLAAILLAIALICAVVASVFCWKRLQRPRRLWLTGEYQGMTKRGHIIWELRGVYTSRPSALASCTKKNHFITLLETDQLLPEKKEDLPTVEYPLIKEAN